MIWCTIDPQINPEARINHVKRDDYRIDVRIPGFDEVRKAGVVGVKPQGAAPRPDRPPRKTARHRGPVTVPWHAA